jgi:heptosyltransferase-1
MHVLIVKVSSLGDVIHTLPALTDAQRAIPQIKFDWVVEEAFTEIPAWHAAVNKVIPVAFRRWKKNIFTLFFNREYKEFKNTLKQTKYDLIIDAQGLLKSGLICSMARGKVAGLDKDSAKEPATCRFYDETYAVPREQHAVERTRQLFSQALGYSLEDQNLEYGLSLVENQTTKNNSDRTLYFLHGTTWQTKLWPEQYWIELGNRAVSEGYKIKLVWGNEEEKQRAERIAESVPDSTVMGQLSLTEIAKEFSQTDIIIAVDTGLAHLAAALDRPTIALYGATDPEKTSTYGKHQLHLKASLSCSPCLNKKCQYRGEDLSEEQKQNVFAVDPPCFSTLPPDTVWQNITELAQGNY